MQEIKTDSLLRSLQLRLNTLTFFFVLFVFVLFLNIFLKKAGNADCVTLLRLASLAAAEKDRGDFSGLLEEFSRNLAEQREHAK